MVLSFTRTVRSMVLPFSLHLKVRLTVLSALTVLLMISSPTVRGSFDTAGTLVVPSADTTIPAVRTRTKTAARIPREQRDVDKVFNKVDGTSLRKRGTCFWRFVI